MLSNWCMNVMALCDKKKKSYLWGRNRSRVLSLQVSYWLLSWERRGRILKVTWHWEEITLQHNRTKQMHPKRKKKEKEGLTWVCFVWDPDGGRSPCCTLSGRRDSAAVHILCRFNLDGIWIQRQWTVLLSIYDAFSGCIYCQTLNADQFEISIQKNDSLMSWLLCCYQRTEKKNICGPHVSAFWPGPW